MDAVNEVVHTQPGVGLFDAVRRRAFTENGGSLYYEFVPTAQHAGLVECATPECDSAGQLLLYQRAQERLLELATARVKARLHHRGIAGELTLIKNCRDVEGNVYGAQESYELTIAQGMALWGWRLAVLAAVPPALVASALHWGLLLAAVAVAVPSLLVVLSAGFVVATYRGGDDGFHGLTHLIERTTDWVVRAEWRLMSLAMAPSVGLIAIGAHAFAFRPYRRGALAFLVSRAVLSGAGTLTPPATWALSEKASAMRRLMRWGPSNHDRGLLEIGHLMKPLAALGWGNIRGVLDLMRPRQRFQLGLSDANRCDVAEYLKVGTTALVLRMVEHGWLHDAPQFADPVGVARTLSDHPSLEVTVMDRDGRRWSALQLQRWYVEQAQAWLDEVVDLETAQLVKLWRETLDALETDPEQLVGRLDWITKRALVRHTVLDDDPWAAKKVDVRYHELGAQGYHRWLEEAGLHVRLVDPDDVDRAMREPPASTPARQRGALVRALARAGTHARVGWDRVVLERGRVIPLRPPGDD